MDVFAFWGKTIRQEGAMVAVHPLLCHMIDVAEVTGALWEHSLGAGMRASIARSLGCAEQEARRTLMFWAALHDLGKASPVFQQRYAPAVPRLEAEGLSFRREYGSSNPGWHGVISARCLPPLLEAAGAAPALAKDLARGLGGHHGSWPTPIEMSGLNSDHLGDAGWDRARATLADALAALYAPAPCPLPQPRAERQALVTLLSGLVSVADWLGSIEERFPPAPETTDPAAYAGTAARQAAAALHALGWDAWQAPEDARDLRSLFPLIVTPNAVQCAVGELAPHLDSPALVLIEAPTGSGKTEAALLLADHLAVSQGQRGLYMAMPTTATSNAMHDRLSAMLDDRYGKGVVTPLLVHGQALWRDPPPEIRSEHEAEEGDGTDAMAWFLPRKRSLLASFGVGTVDQSLLSVLLTKHFFVRLFGLAHKTVVFDEVHAYDTYMSTLFQRLLGWLRAAGTSVILLSATLPQSTRRDLLRAWGTEDPGTLSTAYPTVTWACADKSGCLTPAPEADHALALERLSPNPQALVEALRQGLAGGGCAAVLCNTVGRAQQVYRQLREASLVPEQDLTLFHARYPLAWRREIEERIKARYGKASEPGQRHGIVVATQVIEQSLDLDFDLMVSDLAPVDLLLQRAGRLHRHPGRVRPAALAAPRLLLVEPERIGALPRWGNDAYVYEPYILLRTWLALEGREAWHLPSETRALIESVYGEHELDVQGPLAVALQEYRLDWDQSRREDAQKARTALVLPADDEDLLRQLNPFLAEETPEVHHAMRAATRLGDPGLSVVCLHRREGALYTEPDGGLRIDLDRPPTHGETAHLAQCIVGVSHRGVVQALLAQAVPPCWRKNGLLRNARVAVFESGVHNVAGAGANYALCLSREFGLEIERQSAQQEER